MSEDQQHPNQNDDSQALVAWFSWVRRGAAGIALWGRLCCSLGRGRQLPQGVTETKGRLAGHPRHGKSVSTDRRLLFLCGAVPSLRGLPTFFAVGLFFVPLGRPGLRFSGGGVSAAKSSRVASDSPVALLLLVGVIAAVVIRFGNARLESVMPTGRGIVADLHWKSARFSAAGAVPVPSPTLNEEKRRVLSRLKDAVSLDELPTPYSTSYSVAD